MYEISCLNWPGVGLIVLGLGMGSFALTMTVLGVRGFLRGDIEDEPEAGDVSGWGTPRRS